MKSLYFGLVLLIITALPLLSQTRKEIDWTPCKAVTDQFKTQVEKFNAEHTDGLQIMLDCIYGGDPHRKQKPERRVPLTASEIKRLHDLRKVENAGFQTMNEYELYLFHVHHIRKLEIGDPCYNFAGIKVDDDFITVDPNPMAPDAEGCDL